MVWNESQFGFGAGSTDSGVRQNGELTANPASGSEVNVLASQANWAWPAAVREIFRPRGVNLLVAENAGDFVSIIKNKRIHTTILDVDSGVWSALTTVRIIRMDFPLMPCILLSSPPQGGRGAGSSARQCAEAQRLQCDRQAGRYGPSARAVEQVVHQKVRQPHFCMMRCMAHLGRHST